MKKRSFFCLLTYLILNTCTSVFAAKSDSNVTATISQIQNINFPDIAIGNIDPTIPELLSGYLVQGECSIEAQSNGRAGYAVTISQAGVSRGEPFRLSDARGGDFIELHLYKDTSQNAGVISSPPTDGTQLAAGSIVFDFAKETLLQQNASIKAVMRGKQFNSISEGNYTGVITMTLTDKS